MGPATGLDSKASSKLVAYVFADWMEDATISWRVCVGTDATDRREEDRDAKRSSNPFRMDRRVLAALETAVCSILFSACSVSMMLESAPLMGSNMEDDVAVSITCFAFSCTSDMGDDDTGDDNTVDSSDS